MLGKLDAIIPVITMVSRWYPPRSGLRAMIIGTRSSITSTDKGDRLFTTVELGNAALWLERKKLRKGVVGESCHTSQR